MNLNEKIKKWSVNNILITFNHNIDLLVVNKFINILYSFINYKIHYIVENNLIIFFLKIFLEKFSINNILEIINKEIKLYLTIKFICTSKQEDSLNIINFNLQNNIINSSILKFSTIDEIIKNDQIVLYKPIINKFNSINVLKIIIPNKYKLYKILNFLSIFGNIENCFVTQSDFLFLKLENYSYINELLKIKNIMKKLKIYIKKETLYFYKNITFCYNFIEEFKLKNKYLRNNNKFISKFNPPSNIIIISNIDKSLKKIIILNLIQKYQEPLLLKFSVKNKNSDTNICIVMFKTILESIDVIMNLHNRVFCNKLIKVNFSFNKFKI